MKRGCCPEVLMVQHSKVGRRAAGFTPAVKTPTSRRFHGGGKNPPPPPPTLFPARPRARGPAQHPHPRGAHGPPPPGGKRGGRSGARPAGGTGGGPAESAAPPGRGSSPPGS